jgi:aryl-alcohol dehydrogenase-like predicted oxidoreductase
VSNYNISEMMRMHNRLQSHGLQLASNQVEFSLLRTLPEKSGLLKTAHEHGITILAYSPLGMGKLTGTYKRLLFKKLLYLLQLPILLLLQESIVARIRQLGLGT